MTSGPPAIPHEPARGRRRILASGGLALLLSTARTPGLASSADSPALQAALGRFAAGAMPREGRVQIELPELVENGNAVPVTVSIDSPMRPDDHVVALALFTSRNPQPDVAVFTLGSQAGRAQVSTRMRLATSQQVVAAARLSDGSVWTRTVDVLVTLAACVES